MASNIQISRGDIVAREAASPLSGGELFWQARKVKDEETPISKNYDEGTLWIGDPTLTGDGAPLPIGGTRSVKSLVYKGDLSSELNILDKAFDKVRVGDFFIWSSDAVYDATTDSVFFTKDHFKKGDLLVITKINLEGPDDFVNNIAKDGTIIDHKLLQYQRIMCSSGNARGIDFCKKDKSTWDDFKTNDVEGALLELQYEKLQYKGVIDKSIPLDPEIGGLYLIDLDKVTFNKNTEHEFDGLRGNFVVWTRDRLYKDPDNKTYETQYYWQLIPSGKSSAERISYFNTTNALDKKVLINSLRERRFSENFIQEFDRSSGNVYNMLNFLIKRKAEVTEDGKVPLDQLPESLVGALYFRGVVPLEKVPLDEYTSDEFVKFLNEFLEDGPLTDGNYVIFSCLPGTHKTFNVDGIPYGVGDWAIYHKKNNQDVIERLNASASVDNVNGKKASVVIRGDGRTGIHVENSGPDIVLEAPSHLRSNVNIPPTHIPIIKEENSFEVVDSMVGIITSTNFTNTVLKDDYRKVHVEFPKASGQIVTKIADTGTNNFIPKYDSVERLTDSIIEENNKDVILHNEIEGRQTVFDVKSPSDLHVSKGQDTGFYKYDTDKLQDIDGNKVTQETPTTILTDLSTIDCGEWL